MPEREDLYSRRRRSNAVIQVITHPSQPDASYSGKSHILSACADGRLGCNQLKRAVEFFDKSIRRLRSVRPPPRRSFYDRARRAANNANRELTAQGLLICRITSEAFVTSARSASAMAARIMASSEELSSKTSPSSVARMVTVAPSGKLPAQPRSRRHLPFRL